MVFWRGSVFRHCERFLRSNPEKQCHGEVVTHSSLIDTTGFRKTASWRRRPAPVAWPRDQPRDPAKYLTWRTVGEVVKWCGYGVNYGYLRYFVFRSHVVLWIFIDTLDCRVALQKTRNAPRKDGHWESHQRRRHNLHLSHIKCVISVINMIYFLCSNLKFDYPLKSS